MDAVNGGKKVETTTLWQERNEDSDGRGKWREINVRGILRCERNDGDKCRWHIIEVKKRGLERVR